MEPFYLSRSLRVWTLFVIIFTSVFTQCKKTDLAFDEKKAIEEKFFRLPKNSSPELKALAEKMRAGKFKGEYLKSFTEKNGYPVWEKAIFYNHSTRSTNQRSTSEAQEMFFVPFTLNQEVKAYLASIKNDAGYKTRTHTKAYLSSLRTSNKDTANLIKSKLAVFAYFEKTIHNREETLFESPLVKKIKNVSITFKPKITNRSGRIAGYEYWEVEVCSEESGGGSGDYPENVVRLTSTTTCKTYSGWTWVDDKDDAGGGGSNGGSGTGDGGTGDGGGGTGGGGGGSYTDPMIEVYSGDGDDDPDDNTDYQGQGVRIPNPITLPNGNIVYVDFFKTQSDGVSSDQLVAPRVLEALISALSYMDQFIGVYSIGISATTNGKHAPTSNHYKGLAVDISRINRTRIAELGSSSELVRLLQTGLDSYPHIRENFGPYFKHKFTNPYSVSGHQDHIHFSVNGN